ncbi:tail protein X [Fundidesulfovibrio butyratiphilus]
MSYIIHTVADGDRWDLLAWRYYADPYAYERILAANPHVAMAPVLTAGQRLLIPVITSSTAIASEDLPPWKR